MTGGTVRLDRPLHLPYPGRMSTLSARPAPELDIDPQVVSAAAFDAWPIAWERAATIFPTLDSAMRLYRQMFRFLNPSAGSPTKYDILHHRMFGKVLRYAADLAETVGAQKQDAKFAYLLHLFYFQKEVSGDATGRILSMYSKHPDEDTQDEEWQRLWAALQGVKVSFLKDAMENFGVSGRLVHRSSVQMAWMLVELSQAKVPSGWAGEMTHRCTAKEILTYHAAGMPQRWFMRYTYEARKAEPMQARSLVSLYRAGVPVEYIGALRLAGLKPGDIRDAWKKDIPLDYMLALA